MVALSHNSGMIRFRPAKVLPLLFLFTLLNIVNSEAQQKTGLGIFADPMISWFSSDNPAVQNDGTRPGFAFGLNCTRYFARNYALTGSIGLLNAGGRIKYNDTITMFFADPRYSHVKVAPGESVEYRIRYLALSAGLKLQTNRIGRYRFYTNLGFDPKIAIRARADIASLGISNEKPDNDIRLLNLGYHVTAAMEYTLEGETVLVIGLNMETNFLDSTTNSGFRPEDVLSHKMLSLRLGVNF
jgi:Outer membrane protein beta-barrel domain